MDCLIPSSPRTVGSARYIRRRYVGYTNISSSRVSPDTHMPPWTSASNNSHWQQSTRLQQSIKFPRNNHPGPTHDARFVIVPVKRPGVCSKTAVYPTQLTPLSYNRRSPQSRVVIWRKTYTCNNWQQERRNVRATPVSAVDPGISPAWFVWFLITEKLVSDISDCPPSANEYRLNPARSR